VQVKKVEEKPVKKTSSPRGKVTTPKRASKPVKKKAGSGKKKVASKKVSKPAKKAKAKPVTSSPKGKKIKK
jgi:hypothetical protein